MKRALKLAGAFSILVLAGCVKDKPVSSTGAGPTAGNTSPGMPPAVIVGRAAVRGVSGESGTVAPSLPPYKWIEPPARPEERVYQGTVSK